ncbi:MAG: hypothetical protein OEZ20_02110 [candidate division WOR-3 bacterium]|nr:hypothetical protein [candidate division WOR-3 bacterium]
MIFFGDDVELVSGTSATISQDVFCVGGFGIKSIDSIQKVERIIELVKSNYDIPPYLPLKWNMKDTKLEQLYKEKGKEKLLAKVRQQSASIRTEIMAKLPPLGIRVIVASTRNLKTWLRNQPKNQLYEWGFTALLQRFGMASKGDPQSFIILDWESDRRDIYCKTYQNGYYKGTGRTGELYLSGPLQNIPAIPYLSFSVTAYNPILQLADLIVGYAGALIEWCYARKNERVVKELFPYMNQCFDKSPSGEILGWGLVIQPKTDKPIIWRKIKSL